MPDAFIDRLERAPRGGGFRMEDYWVWCGSVIKGDDDRYHMFASRWPKAMRFSPHWVTNSEVVRASADTPLGPFEFEEVALPPRGAEFWDGRMTHNPTIHKSGDTYLLFYTGTTYDEDPPTPDNQLEGGCFSTDQGRKAQSQQRIGVATSKSVFGPWERRDAPILMPRPGKWDGLITTNAAPCALDGNAVLLVYKSIGFQGDLLRMGIARAEHYDGPYERLQDEPIFQWDDSGNHVEDAYLWRNREGGFEIIMKDIRGGIGGEKWGGVHGTSPDGQAWTISDPPQAYSRTLTWNDGTKTTLPAFERPQLLIEDGVPTHLYAAVGELPEAREAFDEDARYDSFGHTWNQVVPLHV